MQPRNDRSREERERARGEPKKTVVVLKNSDHMKSSKCTAEFHRKCSQETTDCEKSESERERERQRVREQERATESEETERWSWGVATLAASEWGGGGTAGTCSGRFSFALVSSGRRTREPLVLSQRGRSTGQRTADIPSNNAGQEPVLAGYHRPFLEVWTCTRRLSTGYILLTRQATHCQHP
jgi:hypothetical protein